MTKSSYKRLTNKDRDHLETMLNENMKLKDIALALSRDQRGIAYEIKKHRYLQVRANQRNKYGLQNSCDERRLCTNCSSGLCKYCSVFKSCNDICPLFLDTPDCKMAIRFPFVCNGCSSLKQCNLPKYFYKGYKANEEYRANVSDYKKHPKLNETEMKELDYLISQSIRNGHSIAVALKIHNRQEAISTIYNYINDGRLSIKNIDLKRKVRYRKRIKSKPKLKPLNYNYLQNRTYEDFGKYMIDNPDINLWQMDTIEGIKGYNEAALLTLYYTKSKLQLYFKISSICEEEDDRILSSIKQFLGIDLFKETFEVILTDNGKEFKDPINLETDPLTGEILTKIFYCEPRRSDQKGACEKNHEHPREIVPKGISFNSYSSKDINYISNQVNNYPRDSLNYNSPLEVSKLLLNEKVFELNKLKSINPKDVVLKPLIK